ncbi:DUF1579 domain-containing protein [Caulobacter sp.]|uniref:DUF1579 domain-containing protein n=1 Tax=Caulobacter sp. TaxID=78 RepID=UPI001B165154|nr:DUF1579 domain-containing protein [Caulobacter sp.]MBO9545395.1 DUF1579 domain-containing protein [Caulobacter sp.]
MDLCRRDLMGLVLATPGLIAAREAFAGEGRGSIHDFDFFIGAWTVRHRRLRKRLAGNNDWEEFDGTTTCQALLGGVVNLNESKAMRASGPTAGMGLRAYDANTDTWADWTLSAANPHEIGPPGIGRFANGVGTFLSDETFEGRPIKVRGQFRSLSPGEAQWDQAFSPDGGASWETNWIMRYSKVSA